MDTFFPNLHWTNLLIIPSMLLAFTVHELGHAFMAYFLGDRSQVEQGNITLNPLRHISWFGSIFFLLTGYLGWPKTLNINPHNLQKNYLGLFLVALAGPFASLTLAMGGLLLTTLTISILVTFANLSTNEALLMIVPPIFNPVATVLPTTLTIETIAMAFTSYIFITSLSLTCISLIPLPGFDGFTALVSLFVFLRERNQSSSSLPGQAEAPAPGQLRQPMAPAKQRKHRNSIAEIHFKIGTEFHAEDKFDDAIARYRQALQNDDHFGPAYINMGLAYLAKNSHKEALHAFRGAMKYADDQKSQLEARQQLHQLIQENAGPKDEQTRSQSQPGAAPWTDTEARPNWLVLGINSSLLLLGGAILYGVLLFQLLTMLQA